MSNASIIAESLGPFKRNGEWYKCKCPIHKDNKPSLGIKDGEDGSVIFNCLAGCNSKDIADHFKSNGFQVHKNKEQLEEIKHTKPQEICRYQYISQDGELLYEKIRFEPKGFIIVNPHGTGDGGHKGCLYNAQNLNNIEGKVVYIVEGEKDVDTLTGLNFIATTSGGASGWPDKNNHLFSGCHVRIIPDNDDPGREYAKKIRESLDGIASSVRIMFVPDKYKDISDWVHDGAKPSDIEGLFNKHNFKTISFSNLLKLDLKTNWIIKDYIEEHGMVQIFGASGSGKSFFALDIAYCAASGTSFFGKFTKKCNVLYIAGEGFNGLKKRAMALQNKYNADIECLEFSMQAAELMSESSCIDVADRIKNNDGGFDLIFIDTLNRNMGAGDENSTKDMTLFISNIDKYIRSLGCAVVIVHHTGLMNKDRARGSGAMYNAIDAEFKVAKDDGGLMTISCTKQKEGESGWDKQLVLKTVVVGYDEDQESIYSCIIEDNDELVNDTCLSTTEQSVFDGLRESLIGDGIDVFINDANVVAIGEEKWREYAYKRLTGKNLRRDFSTCKNSLIKKGLVFVEDNLFYIL